MHETYRREGNSARGRRLLGKITRYCVSHGVHVYSFRIAGFIQRLELPSASSAPFYFAPEQQIPMIRRKTQSERENAHAARLIQRSGP